MLTESSIRIARVLLTELEKDTSRLFNGQGAVNLLGDAIICHLAEIVKFDLPISTSADMPRLNRLIAHAKEFLSIFNGK